MHDAGSGFFWLYNLGAAYKVALTDIIYIEANGYCTNVVMKKEDGTLRSIGSGYPLCSYNGYLNDDFFRVHHSYVVNLLYFGSVHEGHLFCFNIAGVAPVPISRRKKAKVMKRLGR